MFFTNRKSALRRAGLLSLTVWIFGAAPAAAQNLPPQKEAVFKSVDENAKAIALLGDNIFYFAELGMQEFETAKLMTGILEKGGFQVERGISGMPTAFMATYGSGSPVIAIHTEYETTPGNSQTPSVNDHKHMDEGAPCRVEADKPQPALMYGRSLPTKKGHE